MQAEAVAKFSVTSGTAGARVADAMWPEEQWPNTQGTS